MDRLFDAFEGAGHALFLVGGAVRDVLLGRRELASLDDLDFATDASPDETEALLLRAGLTAHGQGKRFGTIGTVLRARGRRGPAHDVQITTFRPTVQAEAAGASAGGSLEDDLSRRDYTINAIARARDGGLIDPFGGRSDLAARRLRAVGDPARMLRDDPLRLLRLARFASTLGFSPDDALLAAARERAPSVLDTSRERWLHELDKLLLGEFVGHGLEQLEATRALAFVLPEVQALVGLHETSPVRHKDVWAHTRQVVSQAPPRREVRWAALLHDVGKAWTRTVDPDGTVRFLGHEALSALLVEGVAARFRLDKRGAARIQALVELHGWPEAYDSSWSDSAVRRFVRGAGDHLDALLELAGADLTTRFDDKRTAAQERLAELRARIDGLARAAALRPELPTGLGTALIEDLGVARGPDVGVAMERVQEAIIEGELPASPSIAECLNYLRAAS